MTDVGAHVRGEHKSLAGPRHAIRQLLKAAREVRVELGQETTASANDQDDDERHRLVDIMDHVIYELNRAVNSGGGQLP